MKMITKQKEKFKSPETAQFVDYFRDFVGKKIIVDDAKKRWMKIESVRKNSGVRVLFASGNEKPKEEILKIPSQWERLRKLIEWTASRNLKNNEKKEEINDVSKEKIKKTVVKKPKLAIDDKSFVFAEKKQEILNNEIKEAKEDIQSGFSEEIDFEKRKDGNKEVWEKKVEKVKTILELCDIIDEIGFTRVKSEVVHPATMGVRLEILEKFTSKELLEWKLEEITEEFGIRKKVRELKMKESEGILEEVVSLDKAREEKSKKKVDLEKIEKELAEAKAKYETMLAKIKDLSGFFRNLSSLKEENNSELQDLKKRYEEKKKEYEGAVSE